MFSSISNNAFGEEKRKKEGEKPRVESQEKTHLKVIKRLAENRICAS